MTFFLSAQPQTVKILFDASKAETAANADWTIDADLHNLSYSSGPPIIGAGNESNPSRFPNPAQSGITGSTSETFWNGALSYWGIDCVNRNYTVETLPYNGQITYGNGGNVQDLSNYDVFIVCEPNILFTAAEKTAIMNFVQNGGGLFMVSDHNASDRNNDGDDSPHIWNDLMSNNSVQNNPFGMTFDYVDIVQVTTNIPNLPTDSILHGPAGNVASAEWVNGTTLTINTAQNSTVKGVIYKTSSSFGNNNVMCAYARFGNGKVAAIGDSSPCDDGTGDNNDGLFNGYTGDASGNHRKLLMNITIWLATSNAASQPTADFTGNPLNVCTGQPVTFTNTSTGTVSGYSWNFGSGASPATANTAGPHSVNYSTTGLKTISLTVSNAGGSNTMTKTDYVNVSACPSIDLGVLSLINPVSVNCPLNNNQMKVRVKNYGTASVNFAANNLSVILQAADPSAAISSFTKTINTGTLAAAATLDVTFDSTYDLSAAGNYIFNSNTIMAADGNAANNAMTADTVTVSQSFESEYTVISESIGNVSTTTAISTHENNNGFDNDNILFSGTADVRSTQISSGYTEASAGANIFFTNTVGKNLIISGINTSSNSNLQLSFGIYKNASGATGSDFDVQVSSDGITYTDLTIPVLPSGAVWNYITVSGAMPAVSNLRIQFIQNSASTQYRIDDLLLAEIRTAPLITSPGSLTFCQGGSTSLIASPAASYLWSNGMTTQNITVITAGNFIVTETSANGCTASSSAVNTLVKPVYNNTVNVSICEGSSYTLPGGQVVNSTGNYTSSLLSISGCDSIININLNVIAITDNDACTSDACDPTTLVVTHSPVNINDNNVCTTDACNPSTGSITHTAVNTNDNNLCTIDGCDPVDGIFHNPANEICGNGIDDDCDGFTDEGCSTVLNLKMFIEGYYLQGPGGGMMNDNFGGGGLLFYLGTPLSSYNDMDTVTISVMNSAGPYDLVESKKGILHVNGTVSVTFSNSVVSGNNYYIKVNHRNALETWSADPVLFAAITSYDFTTAQSKAFGNNMTLISDSSGWAFYSGDISSSTGPPGMQDGIVESQDYSDMENAVSGVLQGYITEDITGDGLVESLDYSIMENRVYEVVLSVRP